MTEGRVEGRNRRDEAKSHSNVRETRLLKGQGRNECIPWQNPGNMPAMREAVQTLCCTQWKGALWKERTPHHNPVKCSHIGHYIKASSSLMPLFQRHSLEKGNTGGLKKKKIRMKTKTYKESCTSWVAHSALILSPPGFRDKQLEK